MENSNLDFKNILWRRFPKNPETCIICLDYMVDFYTKIKDMSDGINKKKREEHKTCNGHKVHMKCYKEYMDRANHLCPLCKKNIVDTIGIETGEKKKTKMIDFKELISSNPFEKQIIFCTQNLRGLFYSYITNKLPTHMIHDVHRIQVYGQIIE